MHGPVVAGLDARPASQDALELAATICERLDAGLIAVHVPESAQLFSPEYDQPGQRDLRSRIGRLRSEVGPYLERVPAGRRRDVRAFHALTPAAGLRELAASERARLVAVGSSHHTPLGRMLVGSTASHLLLHPACPIALAPRGLAKRERQRVGAIGVALNGSSSSSARAYAESLADELGADLMELHVDHGSAARRLAHASVELDLLVVGCRQTGGLAGHPTLTSVSRRLLGSSACPVVVVPESLTEVPA